MTVDVASFPVSIVGTGRARGQIAITRCPGTGGGPPGIGARLLERDVETIVRWGAQTVVTLLNDMEMARLRVKSLPLMLSARGITWHQVPLDLQRIPDPVFEEAWLRIAPALLALLWDGGRIAIHCWDGRGRAGLVAARLLVESGCAAHDAINRVRAARQGALDTLAQQDYVRTQSPHIVLDEALRALTSSDAETHEPAAAEAMAAYTAARLVSAAR